MLHPHLYTRWWPVNADNKHKDDINTLLGSDPWLHGCNEAEGNASSQSLGKWPAILYQVLTKTKFWELAPRMENKPSRYAVLFCMSLSGNFRQYPLLLGQQAIWLRLLFEALSTTSKLTLKLCSVSYALCYSQGAARLMIPSTRISCSRSSRQGSRAPRARSPGLPARTQPAHCSPAYYNAFRLRQLPLAFNCHWRLFIWTEIKEKKL